MKSLIKTSNPLLKLLLINIILITATVTSLKNELALTPPMGWNSWNYFNCNITEEIIRQTADYMVSTGLKDLGYEYINIDDCWQRSRDFENRIVEDKARFPSGMKALADYIHSLGLKFGIYSSAGVLTCQYRPGSLFYEDIDAQTYADWDVDYLKYDNCANLSITGKIRYSTMRDALLKTGRPIVYSICSWGEEEVHKWGAEVGNLWRTTGDIEDTWTSFLNILDKQFGLEEFAGPGAWNDPDMLEVGNGGMTDNEYQSHFALWSLLKAPLIIGCDVANMSESTKAILMNEDIININQDSLGKQGKRFSREEKETGALEIYAGELSSGHAIILFNRSLNKESMTVKFEDVGYVYPGGNLANLITGDNFGYVEGSYTTDVEPHSVVVLKLHTYCFKGGNCDVKENIKK